MDFSAISNWTTKAYDDVVSFATSTADSASNIGTETISYTSNLANWFSILFIWTGRGLAILLSLTFLWAFISVGRRYYFCAYDCYLHCRNRRTAAADDAANSQDIEMRAWGRRRSSLE